MEALRNRLKSKKSRRLYDIGPFYYQCAEHDNKDCVSACITCVELLCIKCLGTHGHTQTGCHVIQFDHDRAHEACEQLKTSLLDKINYINESVGQIRSDMVKKKKRMLRKKHETALEIELFFNRLRDKLDEKLKHDEKELMDLLDAKVTDEDSTLSSCILQCNDILTSLREKNAAVTASEVRKLDRTLVSRYLKYLLQTGNDVSLIEHHRSDLLLSRDAFLVIRLCIDSQTHYTMLNNPVAEVEVIHSNFDDTSISDLPSPTMEQPLVDLTTPVSPVSDQSASSSLAHCDSLSVFDMPLRVQLDDPSRRDVTRPLDVPLIDFSEDVLHSPTQIQPVGCNNASSDTITEGNIATLNPNENVSQQCEDIDNENLIDSHSNTAENTDNQVNPVAPVSGLSNTELNAVADTNANSQSTGCNDIDIVDSDVMNMVSEIVFMDNVDSLDSGNHSSPMSSVPGAPATAEVDVERGIATTTVNPEAPTVQSSIPYPDDPPPPYPGTTHASVSPLPGPNELPPPYPGLAPPPYSRAPRRPGRRRMNPENRNTNNRNQHESRSMSPHSDAQRNNRSSSLWSDVRQPIGPLVSFSNNETNDKRAPGIISMAVYDGNSYLFVDRWNKKLKYFSGMGVSIGGLIFREEPWDVAKIHDDMYAVTVPKLKTIYKIRTDSQGVQTIGTLSTINRYACLDFDSTNLALVCGQVPQFGEPVIDILSLDTGTVMYSLKKDSYGIDFLSYPRYIKVTNGGICVVCDWNKKCLVFFKLDGQVLGHYKGTREHPLNEPTGVELDKETNTVYVIDAKFTDDCGAIHAVSLDSVCSAIYGGPVDFRHARALALVKNKLAVGSKNGMLNVYQLRRRYRARTEA